jgi:hypothetical protein
MEGTRPPVDIVLHSDGAEARGGGCQGSVIASHVPLCSGVKIAEGRGKGGRGMRGGENEDKERRRVFRAYVP